MTVMLMIGIVVIYFIAEVLCDSIVLQSRLRVAGLIVSVFLAVWIMAIASTQPMPDHMASILSLTLPAWGAK